MYLAAIGNLVNPQAIALTRANAYAAAKVVLGLEAPMTTLMLIANNYTQYVIPKTNRALSQQQILGDLEFARFVSAGQDAAASGGGSETAKIEKDVSGTLGPTDSPLGLPNWIFYIGLAAGVYYLYKKKKFPFAKKPIPAALIPTPPKA